MDFIKKLKQINLLSYIESTVSPKVMKTDVNTCKFEKRSICLSDKHVTFNTGVNYICLILWRNNSNENTENYGTLNRKGLSIQIFNIKYIKKPQRWFIFVCGFFFDWFSIVEIELRFPEMDIPQNYKNVNECCKDNLGGLESGHETSYFKAQYILLFHFLCSLCVNFCSKVFLLILLKYFRSLL